MGALISVVLPVYDEAPGLREALEVLGRVLDGLGRDYEILCVDDGSTDASGELLDAAAAEDPRIVALHFSRNFGKEAALQAGLEAAR